MCVPAAGNILSIAVFNFCGITITKEMSATTRQVLDGGRVIIIWAVSLAVRWQPFDYRSHLIIFYSLKTVGEMQLCVQSSYT